MGIFSFLLPKTGVVDDDSNSRDKPASNIKQYPFYIKAAAVLLALFLFIYMLVLLQSILVPVCFAGLIAILLNPIVNRMVKWRIPRPVSILLAVLIAVFSFAGVMFFLSAQMVHFSEMAPEFKQRGSQLAHSLQQWIQSSLHYSIAKQDRLLQDAANNLQPYLTGALGSLMAVISVLILLPVYIFLILYYKPLFLNFFYEVFEDRHERKVAEILGETKKSVQSYVSGLLIETVVVAVMNSVALLLLGVKYAVLLGVIGAILNIIPYIGGIIAIALPVLLSMVSGDGGISTPLLIVGSYLVIQFVDNNLLVPKIVSSKVDVNAFVSIIVVLMGGAMWGISGMFLSIPMIAICKIIFDRVERLKPWGKILGVKMNALPVMKTKAAEGSLEEGATAAAGGMPIPQTQESN